MKKKLTLLTFVFLNSALLFGQCPDIVTPNPTNKIFNISYAMEADRDMAWAGLGSITFPAGAGCMCGATITIDTAGLEIDGPIGADNVYRIRAKTTTNDYFGGENANFEGNLTFTKLDGTSVTCEYTGTTSVDDYGENSSVRIFPNPVKSQLTLIDAAGEATIYNVLGKAVKQLTIDADQATIQLADLLNGQYYLKVMQADGGIVTRQFSKVN